MNQSHDAVIVPLVVVLILDEAEVDEVAHSRARVPTDVVGVDVDLLQMSYHVILVYDVGLCTRGCGSKAGGVILVAINAGDIDSGKGESVRDLEDTIVVHTNKGASSGRREGRGAVLRDLHHYLNSRMLVSIDSS